MAIIAEQLVEEWFNRQGFFTIRGYKKGNDECDLLGVRIEGRQIEGIHCEVQVSARPIGYVARLPEEERKKLGAKGSSSAKKRPEKMMIGKCVASWMEKKFFNSKKSSMRNELWPGLKKWRMMFVHGKLKDERELDFMKKRGIETRHVSEIFEELKALRKNKGLSTAGLGADMADLFELCTRRQDER